MNHIIGFDAKRLVRNASGLGNYSRTLVGDLLRASTPQWSFRLYAPDEGNPALVSQLQQDPRLTFCYPKADSSLFTLHSSLYWRSRGISRARALNRKGERYSRVVPPFQESPRYLSLPGSSPAGSREFDGWTALTWKVLCIY